MLDGTKPSKVTPMYKRSYNHTIGMLSAISKILEKNKSIFKFRKVHMTMA